MTITKFTHSGGWEENLGVYLFINLVSLSRTVSHLSDYHNFELQDTHIKEYNTWVEEGSHGAIQSWVGANLHLVQDFKNGFGSVYQRKVELWSDRNKTDYYKKNLQASFEFENFLEKYFKENHNIDLEPFITQEGQYLEGENKAGIEIKNDMMYKKTNNLYIEYAEKSKASNSQYVKSGIWKEDKSRYFLIGDYDNFWVFEKSRLIKILEEEQELRKKGLPSKRGVRFITKDTSLGFIFPIVNAGKETVSLETLVSDLKQSKT